MHACIHDPVKPALLATAILFCRPTMAPATAATYANLVHAHAARIGIDPLEMVAVVHHETRWQEWRVNPKSGAVGLGQILPEFRPACVGALASAACAAEKKRLLDGVYNLNVMADAIEKWRATCKQKTGTASGWTWAYAGLNQPKAGKWCGVQVVGTTKKALPIHSVVKSYQAIQRSLRLRLEALPHG